MGQSSKQCPIKILFASLNLNPISSQDDIDNVFNLCQVSSIKHTSSISIQCLILAT